MSGLGTNHPPESWRAFPVNETLQWYLTQTGRQDSRQLTPLAQGEPPLVVSDERDLWDYLGDFA
jgi:hypothetical protein